MENTYIKTFGQGKVYVQHGDEEEIHAAKWDVDYDGNEWDIDLHVDHNGEKKHIHETLGTEDMYQMLQRPSTPGLLDKRIRQDFLVDQKIYKIIPREGRRRRSVAMIDTRKRTPIKIPLSSVIRTTSPKKTSLRKSSKKTSSKRKSSKRKSSKRKSSKKTSTQPNSGAKRKTKKTSPIKKSSRTSSVKRIRKQVLKHLATPKPATKRIHLTN